MNSLTRQLGRIALTGTRTAPCLTTPRPSLLNPSRLSIPSTSALSARCYATESSHLGNLSPAPGSAHKRKRIGRGIGSGRGGTSGRGHKGQGARSGNGKPALHFAGGQTPITRAYPKRGFKNPLNQQMTPLNLDRLQHWIDRGLIDPSQPITMKELFETRCVHGIRDGVKLLGDGAENFTTPNVQIEVSKASQSAIKAIERLGGSLVERYENRLTLRALINPDSFHRHNLDIPGKADPVSRRDLLYYSDSRQHRGYLGLQAAKKADEEVREEALKAVAEQEAGESKA
ncbi:ribosomal protein L18e/L15P [Leucosporidium creatinivorum]|uniref:Ribosomal protein L18e/L15P n=1 Tax=Leucosporidium creatinivorum TaxID=106004 RepID=A0A1Y2F640_9BASI|nr:ribosomal protein L18e/L15P [Leucosporidium creatinivorum]